MPIQYLFTMDLISDLDAIMVLALSGLYIKSVLWIARGPKGTFPSYALPVAALLSSAFPTSAFPNTDMATSPFLGLA